MAARPFMPMTMLRECPDCGLWTRLGAQRAGHELRCPRCDGCVRGVPRRTFDVPLAVAAAGLLFYFVSISTPFLTAMLYGPAQTGTLVTGPVILRAEGWWLLSALVLLTTVILPATNLLGVIAVLVGLRANVRRETLANLFRWTGTLRPWAMIEVYLLGFMVAYTRLTAVAWVTIDAATFSLAALVLATLFVDVALDGHAVWEALEPPEPAAGELAPANGALLSCRVCLRAAHALPGQHCARCGARLAARKPNSTGRTWALIIAAAILYVPANIFSVMNVNSAYPQAAIALMYVHTGSYTILGGVEELAAAGYWPTALLVLTASIIVPALKMLGLATMLLLTRRRSAALLRARTRLWGLIRFIGRWSMIDVCMISLVVALLRFGQLANATTGIGMVCFAAVVVLTMLATESFDTRLMWDAADGRRSLATARAAQRPLTA